MKLKHLTIIFLTFAILSYVVFMLIQNYVAIEAEKVRVAEIEKAEKANEARKARAIEIAKAKQADVQRLFDRLFKDMTKYSRGLNHNMDIAKEILKLEDLIAQGANPNKRFEIGSDGDEGKLDTPISYIFFTCARDSYIEGADGRNFYLEIIKLLIDSGVDWNAKNYYEGEDYSGTTTIADTLKWMEDEDENHKPECLEALNYVKNHLKENNIIIEE